MQRSKLEKNALLMIKKKFLGRKPISSSSISRNWGFTKQRSNMEKPADIYFKVHLHET